MERFQKFILIFFELTNNWHDITEKVRHNLVTGATTHYKDADFDIDIFSLQNLLFQISY